MSREKPYGLITSGRVAGIDQNCNILDAREPEKRPAFAEQIQKLPDMVEWRLRSMGDGKM
jgi:hypothetical protein